MFLDDAMRDAAGEAAMRQLLVPVEELEWLASKRRPAPSFRESIRRDGGPVRIIAEVKRRSPSAGDIKPDADAASVARAYELAGASAVSVLTSGMFGGSLSDLVEVSGSCSLPVLRKDFISTEYQVLEARAFGASAVLLIADALDDAGLQRLLGTARGLGLDALVETHGADALERAVEAGAGIIGINNRDLRTLEVDVGVTEESMGCVPHDDVVVSESGIRDRECVERMEALGVDALLVGEELMRASDPGLRLGRLLGAAGTTGRCRRCG